MRVIPIKTRAAVSGRDVRRVRVSMTKEIMQLTGQRAPSVTCSFYLPYMTPPPLLGWAMENTGREVADLFPCACVGWETWTICEANF